MLHLVEFLRHHVHVGLQHHALTVFPTGSGGLPHDDVFCIILKSLHAVLCSPLEQELLNLFEMTARAGHLSEQVEILPDSLGIEILNVHRILILVKDKAARA